jgi:hypothetical protein
MRVVSVAVSALMGLALLAPTFVAAKDTRQLYVGDPTQVGSAPTPYQIHPTLVSPVQVTYFDVLIKNKGTQTLTGATVAMGSLVAKSGANGETGLPLPPNWSVKSVVYVSGAQPTCTYDPAGPGPYQGFSCNFGNLAARSAGGTIRVFMIAGSSVDESGTWATNALQVSGQVAENVGGNVGSNTNTFYAYGQGNFLVSGPGVVAGFFDGTGGAISPSDHTGTGDQTTIDLSNLSTGAYLVDINEINTSLPCPPALTTCSNSTPTSTAHVNGGFKFSTYFVWTVLFSVPADYKLSTKTGFVHFFDGYPTDPNAYEVFYNQTQYSCATKKSKAPCADFSLVTDPLGLPAGTYLKVIFDTLQNGSGKYI